MFDEQTFDKEIDELIAEGQEQRAEQRMLTAYSELKGTGRSQELEYLLGRLAHFYSSPDTENLDRAENYFLERERLFPGAYNMCQTATFYFYIAANFQAVIRKTDEIVPLPGDRDSYYSALALKGQALIKLGMFAEANRVLEEILRILKTNPQGLPYGDEINLLEAAIPIAVLSQRCHEILELIVPKIRSREYQERARALLKS